jgi:hypothetical protein
VWAGSGRVLLVVVLAVALAACGVVAGAVATWNQALAAALTTAAGRAGPHRPGRGPEQHPGLGQPDRG